jgi:hypothetical protein
VEVGGCEVQRTDEERERKQKNKKNRKREKKENGHGRRLGGEKKDGRWQRGGDERRRRRREVGWPKAWTETVRAAGGGNRRRAKLEIKVKTAAPKAKGVEPSCNADGR